MMQIPQMSVPLHESALITPIHINMGTPAFACPTLEWRRSDATFYYDIQISENEDVRRHYLGESFKF